MEFQECSIYTRKDGTAVCVPHIDIAAYYVFSHVLKGLELRAEICDATMSYDSHIHIPNDIGSIVVANCLNVWGTLPSLVTNGLLS